MTCKILSPDCRVLHKQKLVELCYQINGFWMSGLSLFDDALDNTRPIRLPEGFRWIKYEDTKVDFKLWRDTLVLVRFD